jgi:hypothetical protein
MMHMKKFLVLSIVLLPAFFVQGQTYESVKTLLALMQYKKAKDELDKGMTNAKFASKPEAYIQKTTAYSGVAIDPVTKGTAAGDQLTTEAEAAFAKYREMDPALSFLTDPIYQNGVINIYSSLFSSGYKDYDNKNWQTGFEKFKRVVEYSDLMIAKKIINVMADTNSVLLAGIMAEKSNNLDDAAKYYTRIADLKVTGPDYEGIYRFLVRYYFTKKDMASFDKYKAIGKELYPKSEFFDYDKIDFTVGLEDDFNKKTEALEKTLVTDPNNAKANELLGELIYDTLHSRKADAVMPANAAELEKKMIAAFIKSGELDPASERPFLFLGDHYISKSITANDARDAFDKELKARTKPGTPLSKADQQKKNSLDQDYNDALEAAREPYEKAAAVFAKKEKLGVQDKQQYKKVTGYLADIYTSKKERAKGNAADQAKYAAEEKKWNDVYSSIK